MDRLRDLLRRKLEAGVERLVSAGVPSGPGSRALRAPAGPLRKVTAAKRASPPAAGSYRSELQVVFAQYDTKKYPGSLERLLGLLSGMTGLDYHVLVVDNFRPGDWSHNVTDRLTHVGGDNSQWEFSAFDRGLSHLDAEGARSRVYAFVTDAFTAYGDSFLSLIDRSTFEAAAHLRSVVGWVDAWPEATWIFGKADHEWVRTSFAIVPESVLPAVRPLAYPFDAAALFSGDPAAPFREDAPLGAGLRRYLLEWLSGPQGRPLLSEQWHSNFALDRETLPLFESKVCAILREHLLSARLREARVSCYDLRLFQRLHDGVRTFDDVEPEVLERFSWTRWNVPDEDGALRTFRHHLDVVAVPRHVTHGEPSSAYVEGWLLGSPQPRVVRLWIGSAKCLVGLCDRAREDVVARFPRFVVSNPGFGVSGSLSDLPPGTYELELELGVGPRISLGKVDVAPLFDFRVSRMVIPASWPEGRPVPIALDGELRSSVHAEAVELRIDDRVVEIPAFLGAGIRDPQGFFVHEASINGQVEGLLPGGQHTLEFRFRLANGVEQSWQLPFVVAPREVPCTLRNVAIGPFDPDTGLAAVALEIDVFDVVPGDRLVLERNATPVLESALTVGARDRDSRRASLVVERKVEGIPAGVSLFALVLRRGAKRLVLWNGEFHVRYLHPEIHLERLSVSLVRSETRAGYRIAAAGWIKNHFLVDCLFFEIDDGRAAVIGLHDLRPDVAHAMHESIVSRQGFDASIDVTDITPGEHVVHLIATQKGGERSRVSRRVVFEEPAVRRLTVISDDLERLKKGEARHFYSSITLSGVIESSMEEAIATLLVDDRLADEQPCEGTGRHEFRLRAAPKSSGEYDVRFLVSSRGRVVLSTEPVRVSFRRLEFSPSLTEDLGALLDRFELRSKIVGHGTDADLVSRLVERQPERIPEFTDMLTAAGRRLRAANGAVKRRLDPVPPVSRRRLQVLFASWEVPSRYHGGGVYLTNLLKGLSAYHDITLVHTFGMDEVGHVEAVRPYVRRIISVPRVFRPAQYRGSGQFPLSLYDVYIPELRRVIELELESGAYDLVDYEYSSMGPYVVAGFPAVLTVHEVGYTALLNSVFNRARSADSVVSDLDRLIRSFHYYTSELPALCSHLVTLTEEDAAAISTYADADVYTNPAGVDIDEALVRATRARTSAPVLAYVGNFQHPPNVRAVAFFAEHVMPELRRRYPEAEFRVYGSRVGAGVSELDGKNGVRVEGFVDDLRSALRAATAMVAPIFTGTGMRMKVLEAFGAGALVIGTDLSVRGLAVVDNEHYYRANTASAFVAAVTRAFELPGESSAIARAGQELVASTYGWDTAIRRRETIWFSAVNAANRPVRAAAVTRREVAPPTRG